MKVCEILGCDRPWFCRKWCNTHYAAYLLRRKRGWPEPIDPSTPLPVGRPRYDDEQRREAVRARRKKHGQIMGKKRRDSVRAFIHEVKSTPCMDCGASYPPCVMDFDHRPDEIKSFNISQSPTGSIETLQVEINKCDVVCANCHRLRSWRRLQERRNGS